MNIGIIGIGGVGGYFGGKLTQLLERETELNIYFIARNRHLEEIKKNGLILSTQDDGELICRPTLATDNPDELPELDLCLICVKSYDLDNVLKAIKDKIKDDTKIIPLLNGVDIYERVRKIIKNGIVYPACVYIGTHLERAGKVTQTGGRCMILFGKDPQKDCIIPEKVLELFNESKINYKWLENPYEEIWSKYMFIAAYGMVTASENKTIGEILERKDLSDKTKDIMREIEKIAIKEGVNLADNIVQKSFDKGNNFPYETKTSFQRDFEQKGKKNEKELYGDTIIRLGEKYGIATPKTKVVNDKL